MSYLICFIAGMSGMHLIYQACDWFTRNQTAIRTALRESIRAGISDAVRDELRAANKSGAEKLDK